ncbi:MAG: hypothetical protein D3904_12445 [Candidatus Electrothrix sp. EH2]|nr:hypothetical protein [Candidatus Electrothrix sp. EH2]
MFLHKLLLEKESCVLRNRRAAGQTAKLPIKKIVHGNMAQDKYAAQYSLFPGPDILRHLGDLFCYSHLLPCFSANTSQSCFHLVFS